MSKVEKLAKSGASSPLRSDLSQFVKALQQTLNSVEKHEKNLSEAEIVLKNERALKEENSSLKKQVTELQEAHRQAERELLAERSSYADVNLKLTKEYSTRLAKVTSEYESKLKERNRHEDIQEQKWKQKVEKEKDETRRLKEAEDQDRQGFKSQLEKAEKSWREREEWLQNLLRQKTQDFDYLSHANESLKNILTDHNAMFKGRDIEINMLKTRLAALEAFPPQTTDELNRTIAELQQRLHNFSTQCFHSAEVLPWNQIPNGIRHKYLPRCFSLKSPAGCAVMIAAIQHSICLTLKDNVFLPLGAYSRQKFCKVAENLYQKNQTHEAIWRLMTVTAVLEDQKMQEQCKKDLHEVAGNLLASWSPFPGQSLMKEVRESLTQLLFDCAVIFLQLQRGQNRISVSVDVVSQYFDSDSEEDSHQVPGGFELPDSTVPVLCLFPAFFWGAATATTGSDLLRKGTAMFRDSPPLLVALSEEKEINR